MKKYSLFLFLPFFFLYLGCSRKSTPDQPSAANKIHVIFDTDANNELDDQHALAYLLFNGNTFAVDAITVNATYNGGDIEQQYREAERIVKLCGLEGKIPLLKGANEGFSQIKDQIKGATFDGSAAVNFIIEQARKTTAEKLIVLAVGKLTNVALALEKDPSITGRLRVVWLGSNYPEAGEYNQDNDTIAMNYVLNTDVDFEMVTVRYGKPSGTDAVRATKEEITRQMPGKGPKISTPVMGRHQVAFNNFGDYSVNLFEHIEYHGNPPARALFDMAAVAIVKDPSWATARQIPCPILINNTWIEREGNKRKIIIWENFDREKIMKDFYQTMDKYVLAE
jgi:inosine-uridine nucleoside N-ribohydrolase